MSAFGTQPGFRVEGGLNEIGGRVVCVRVFMVRLRCCVCVCCLVGGGAGEIDGGDGMEVWGAEGLVHWAGFRLGGIAAAGIAVGGIFEEKPGGFFQASAGI